MALYPCSVGSHRYAGRQQSAYVTSLVGNIAETRKSRLCPRHMASLFGVVHGRLTPVDETLQSSLVCERCDSPREVSVFVTLYPLEGEPEAYAGDFCAGHGRDCLAGIGFDGMAPR